LKKPNREKNRLNRLKFKKKRPIRFSFDFISLKPKKPNRIEPNPKKNQAKPEKTKPKWFEPVFVQKNRIKTGRFEPVLVRFWFF